MAWADSGLPSFGSMRTCTSSSSPCTWNEGQISLFVCAVLCVVSRCFKKLKETKCKNKVN